MSKKKYSVVYADPPWNQKGGQNLSGGYKKQNGVQVFNPISKNSQNLPYNTLTVEQIANIGVKQIVEDNAYLFIWVTNKYLLEANKIIEAWGFKYSTCLTWSKKPFGIGMGGTFRISHETLLFCTRGSLKSKRKVVGTVFDIKRPYVNGYPCHSKKPPYFYELIESVSPIGNYIELFARSSRLGWDCWGNEIDNNINLR